MTARWYRNGVIYSPEAVLTHESGGADAAELRGEWAPTLRSGAPDIAGTSPLGRVPTCDVPDSAAAQLADRHPGRAVADVAAALHASSRMVEMSAPALPARVLQVADRLLLESLAGDLTQRPWGLVGSQARVKGDRARGEVAVGATTQPAT